MSNNFTHTIHQSLRDNFKPTYLIVKKHSKTGLLYFCKTTKKCPYKYNGSGVYWKNHIKKYGKEFIKTIWIKYYIDIDELVSDALNISEYHDIANSKLWANLKFENGLDGSPIGAINKRKSLSLARTNFHEMTIEEAKSFLTTLIEQDKSIPEIAKLMGISSAAASIWLKKFNLSRRTFMRNQYELEKLTNSYCLYELSKIYKVSIVGLVQKCTKYNIPFIRRNYNKFPRKLPKIDSITGKFMKS